jgi:hypothetical protein
MMTFEDGEHVDLVVSHAVDEAIGTDQHLSDVVALKLPDDVACERKTCGSLAGGQELVDPARGGDWVIVGV